jgi:hypothetical protein
MNYRDVVYLKNGSIIKGIIIEQVPNVSLKIKTNDGNVLVYEMVQVEKIEKQKDDAPESASFSKEITLHKEEKSPGTAFFYSLLIPGLGQHYCGNNVKGIIQETIYVGGWSLLLTAGISTDHHYDGSYFPYFHEQDKITGWYYLGLSMVIGSYFWSIIDAPLSANDINTEIRNEKAKHYGHLFEYDLDGNNVVGIDPAVFRNGTGATLTIHF